MRFNLSFALLTMAASLALSACSDGTPASSSEFTSKSLAYPLFADGNGNGINDYAERALHEGNGHAYADADGDGVCDFAQDGSPAWHGPGFSDEDGSGVCDRWEEDDSGPHRGSRREQP